MLYYYTICLFMKQFWWNHDFGGLRLRFLMVSLFQIYGNYPDQYSQKWLCHVMPMCPSTGNQSVKSCPRFWRCWNPDDGLPVCLSHCFEYFSRENLGWGLGFWQFRGFPSQHVLKGLSGPYWSMGLNVILIWHHSPLNFNVPWVCPSKNAHHCSLGQLNL